MAEPRIVRVPHRAQRSFDVAHCVCGWHMVSGNAEMLRVWADAHDDAYAGHCVELEEFVPEGDD